MWLTRISQVRRRHQFRVIVVMSCHSAFVDINGERFIIQIVELEGDHFKGNSVAGEESWKKARGSWRSFNVEGEKED